ncbi:peptide chain release factor N(5)-glutamine methyltransferase [Thiobacillus sp.]|uniref:peptide chain release factor N(5)-glutamine methyltransferase n=1 Tax=Thiobacillus sp. TaxID=924 RepID=UPI001D1A9AA5|nr:peptide chain release factor N(5)-glutamine methyltransferase [Thiobacillus sp.]MBC2738971.1 peptide chain release factor N(5)-glutamine methyltransferase [Thiobacillus sp.]MBC2760741.1 peptide chain release factor N(5)-glutamine methyltransferase [Thiobacillus sp.]
MACEAATVASLLDDAATRIGATLGLDTREARLEARVLAAFAWGVAPAWLIAHDTDLPDQAQLAQFRTLLARRLVGEPIAYLTGAREFYGRSFRVSPDVLIPRPDTELLVERALAHMPGDQAVEVLDLGTGSGCIAITLALERPLARVTAVDRSDAALAAAKNNGSILNASVEFLTSDWFSALAGRRFDLIVGNPPYIAAADPHLARGDVRFEPLSALASGPDGLDDLRRLIAAAPGHLKPGGVLLVEHGYDQANAVQALLQAAGFSHPQSWPDLSSIYRVSGGNLSE